MPLTRFEECWPLPMESLLELPKNLNIVTLTLTLTVWPINSGVLTSLLLPHLSSYPTDSLSSLNLLCHSKTDARFMQAFHTFLWHFFQVQNRISLYIVLPHVQIGFLKFTSCDNQALVRCIPIAAVAVHLNLKA